MLLCTYPTGFYPITTNIHFLRRMNFILITFFTLHFVSHKINVSPISNIKELRWWHKYLLFSHRNTHSFIGLKTNSIGRFVSRVKKPALIIANLRCIRNKQFEAPFATLPPFSLSLWRLEKRKVHSYIGILAQLNHSKLWRMYILCMGFRSLKYLWARIFYPYPKETHEKLCKRQKGQSISTYMDTEQSVSTIRTTQKWKNLLHSIRFINMARDGLWLTVKIIHSQRQPLLSKSDRLNESAESLDIGVTSLTFPSEFANSLFY
jgi:hypothetical protein